MSTLLVERHTFHTANVREQNREHFEPSSAGAKGMDYLDFLGGALPANRVHHDAKRNWWTRVSGVEQKPRALFVKAASGPAGQMGQVVDVRTGEPLFDVEPEHVTALQGRALFLVPETGLEALAFYERIGGNSAGIELRNAIKADWRAAHSGVTMKVGWVQTREEFLEEANLKGFEVRRHDAEVPSHLPDEELVGTLSYKAVAQKSHWFSKDLQQQLLAHPEAAHQYFILEPREDDEVALDLKLGEQTRRYVINRGNLPKVSLDLGLRVSDEDFLHACFEKAAAHLSLE